MSNVYMGHQSDCNSLAGPGEVAGHCNCGADEYNAKLNEEAEERAASSAGIAPQVDPVQPAKTVVSYSNERVVNNVMRHEYRVLTDEEKKFMQAVKDKGLELYNLLHSIGGTNPAAGPMASRELSLAATKIEEGVMWAVKHLTK